MPIYYYYYYTVQHYFSAQVPQGSLLTADLCHWTWKMDLFTRKLLPSLFQVSADQKLSTLMTVQQTMWRLLHRYLVSNPVPTVLEYPPQLVITYNLNSPGGSEGMNGSWNLNSQLIPKSNPTKSGLRHCGGKNYCCYQESCPENKQRFGL